MATPTTSSGRIIPTPTLTFVHISQAITCESLQFDWFYSGPESPIDLIATNFDVPQDAPAPSLTPSTTNQPYTGTDKRRAIPTGAASPAPFVTVPIASDIDPTLMAYSWPSINIPQGWYVINASMSADEYSCISSPFFVHTGSDTSCLSTTGNSTSASTTSTPTTSSTSLPVALPVGGASKINVGAIVGASIGAIVLLAAVLTAWIFLQRKGKGLGTLVSGPSRRWNGLSSVDSRALTSTNPQNYSSLRHQTRSESVGTIAVGSEEAVGAEKISIYGKHDESYGPPGGALATMPILQHQSPRSKTASRTYSTSSSTSHDFSPKEIITPPGSRPSVPDSAVDKRSIDSSNTYPPISPVSPHGGRASNHFMTSNMSRSHSSSTSITNQTSTVAQTTPSQSTSSHGLMPQQRLPPSPSPQLDPSSPTRDAVKQANRNSLGGKKRKPVPAYDPSQDPTSPSVPRPMATPSPGPPSPSPDRLINMMANGAHYATRSQVGQDNSQPDLAHKSSFGPGGVEGKPLHYLIPDMPMPLQE